MEFINTTIPEVVIAQPKIHRDPRGYFVETFRQDLWEEYLGFKLNFCQENESKSSFGVLRGLHYQLSPFAQSKLVRVIEGKVLDVAVDIRIGSPTFGKHVAIELSGENKKQLFIPRGFAHGFLVLSDFAIFSYKVDNYYSPNHDRGLLYNSDYLGIDWVLNQSDIKLSKKDETHPNISKIECFEYKSNLYV